MREFFLTMLAAGDAYGYELRQTLERQFGNLLPTLNAGQIYTTLARLERDGLVSGRDIEGDTRGKRVYALTDTGWSELKAWIDAPIQGVRVKDDFFMKFVLAAASGLERPRVLLDKQRLEYLRSLRDLDDLLEQHSESATAELLVEGAILHLKADIEWLDLIERRLSPAEHSA